MEPGTETFLPVKFCDWRGGLKGLILQFERLLRAHDVLDYSARMLGPGRQAGRFELTSYCVLVSWRKSGTKKVSE